MATWQGEPLQVARNQLTDLQRNWRMHQRLCRTCRKLTEIQRRYCDEGWEIAKALRRARQRVAELKAPAGPEQLTLF